MKLEHGVNLFVYFGLMGAALLFALGINVVIGGTLNQLLIALIALGAVTVVGILKGDKPRRAIGWTWLVIAAVGLLVLGASTVLRLGIGWFGMGAMLLVPGLLFAFLVFSLDVRDEASP